MNVIGVSSQSKCSSFSKGGLWTVDADYRRSLLAALKRSPYHPYHSYFTPPLSPRYIHILLTGWMCVCVCVCV